MKIVSRDAAIAAISFVPDEVKPLGGYFIPEMLGAIANRYEFVGLPSVKDAQAAGAKFLHGRFSSGDRGFVIGEMKVHADALSVTTTDTKDSEIVLNELLEWLVATLKFRWPSTPLVRAYQSDLVVEFDAGFDRALADFQPLMKLMERSREKIGHEPKSVQFNRFALGADPMRPGPNAEFLIERQAGAPWESGRYFAKAHLPTDEHIRALQLFEKVLTRSSCFPWT